MTTGKTQTVVSINRSCYNYSHRNVETSNVAGFSKTAERITMKLSDMMEDGFLGANIDDAMTSYIIGTPHIFPRIFLPRNFFLNKYFPAKFFIRKNFFPNFFPQNFFPTISSPKFFSPKFFPQIFDRHLFTCSLFPTSKNSYYVICVAHDIVVCVGAIILSSRNQGLGPLMRILLLRNQGDGLV